MARTKNHTRKRFGLNVEAHKKVLSAAARPAHSEPVKRKRRTTPGISALREIRKYQKSTDFCLRKRPFCRLVREIANDFKTDLKFQSHAIEALQTAAENYIVLLFEWSNRLSIHGKRITITDKDLRLAIFFDTGVYKSYRPDHILVVPQVSDAEADRLHRQREDAKKQRQNKKRRKVAVSAFAVTQQYHG